MFVLRDAHGQLQYSAFSTPLAVTRCTLVENRTVQGKAVMLLRGDDGRRYMVNVADSTAKVLGARVVT